MIFTLCLRKIRQNGAISGKGHFWKILGFPAGARLKTPRTRGRRLFSAWARAKSDFFQTWTTVTKYWFWGATNVNGSIGIAHTSIICSLNSNISDNRRVSLYWVFEYFPMFKNLQIQLNDRIQCPTDGCIDHVWPFSIANSSIVSEGCWIKRLSAFTLKKNIKEYKK